MNEPEPEPKPNSSIALWDLVVNDMQERKEFGIRKYKTPLQFMNGRNAAHDAYQEILDLTVYFRQLLAEWAYITQIVKAAQFFCESGVDDPLRAAVERYNNAAK